MKQHSDAEAYLQDFHRRHAGATSATFSHLPARIGDEEHPSSYHALASRVAANAGTVLDLCCGDGALLCLLAGRRGPPRLIGVDFSHPELAAARTLLPRDVLLVQQRAQQLGIVAGSIDCVTSHMAMMLLDDIESVLAEVARVLRTDGRFAAIVGRNVLLGGLGEVFMNTFRQTAREDGLAPLAMGDARTRSEAGWRELLERDFHHVEYSEVDVLCNQSPEELWHELRLTYDVDRLSDDARTLLRSRFLQGLAPLVQRDGAVHTAWGLALISALIRHT